MTKSPLAALPTRFATAMESVMAMSWRSEISVEEIPPPQRIAPYSVAIAADVDARGQELGNGRLILLHDPAGNPAWGDGEFRCVSYVKADIEPDLATDPYLTGVGWSWLTSALDECGAAHSAAAGTVTFVSSQAFGGIADEPARSEMEIRASWTPLLDADGEGLTAHLSAWQQLVCYVCDLPPIPEGLVAFPNPRWAKR
ncbi:MAG: DUF3000 domain-containing protein [Propionibacteriaceae bacterium]